MRAFPPKTSGRAIRCNPHEARGIFASIPHAGIEIIVSTDD
jgi:hypothetical protein